MEWKQSRLLFFLMFGLVLLLNIDFTILKSIRNTLAVVDLGRSARVIPWFELCGALPGSLAMTWGLSRLLMRFSMPKIFAATMGGFLSFFLLFTLGIYPHLSQEQSPWIVQGYSMLFYVICELWKPALIVILFWGFVNAHMPLLGARKMYAPLMLGGSLGALMAGPIIACCTSHKLWHMCPLAVEHWEHALLAMMIIVVLLGLLSVVAYTCLARYFAVQSVEKKELSLKESVTTCLQTPALRLLAWIVIADYIAYSLGEVLFLEVLKQKFPEACAYCRYIGFLSSWGGALTVFTALIIAPWILQRCRWVVAALIAPLCLLLTEAAFFLVLRAQNISCLWFGWSEGEWMESVVLLGSVQYFLCRAAKYTLFDASKELVYVSLPETYKMRGKLVVDGLCARLGRGSASALNASLIAFCGGVLASAFFSGVMAIAMTLSWVLATCKLGRYMEWEAHCEGYTIREK